MLNKMNYFDDEDMHMDNLLWKNMHEVKYSQKWSGDKGEINMGCLKEDNKYIKHNTCMMID